MRQTKNKHSVLWWIFIGWWLIASYYLLVWWWLVPLKRTLTRKVIPPDFQVKTWGTYLTNLKQYQAKIARKQWHEATYSKKPLYEYSWETITTKAALRAEPNNEHDSNAIAVYLENYHIGYVPRVINEKYHAALLARKNKITVELHGGNRKYIDDYGNLIETEDDPMAEVSFKR